jgi:hypothetical protein
MVGGRNGLFVAQFNLNGELDRFATFGGESVDKINDMAVDNDGNIYIAGEFYQNLQFGNQLLEAGDYLGLYLVKLDQNFDPIWVFQPLGNDLKPGVKLACDLLGRVALAGNFSGSISFRRLLIFKPTILMKTFMWPISILKAI